MRPTPFSALAARPARAARLVRFAALLALPALAAVASAQSAGRATDVQDYSDAERIIFMTEHLGTVQPPQTLNYRFSRHGSLEADFEDRVTLRLTPSAAGTCCTSEADFLSAERRLTLPTVEDARANPVILYFLEHDVRDMSRITKGQQNHFRKRIRMAIYQGARVETRALEYLGRPINARQVLITPYDDDPNRGRFEQYADKQYVFWLSDEVPGGVFGVASRMAAKDAGAEPLIVDEMYLEGATPPDMTALAR
jgi:hypothetical protein